MFWLKLLLGYVIFTFVFVFVFGITEDKIPENTKFKKWWRKYIVSTDPED